MRDPQPASPSSWLTGKISHWVRVCCSCFFSTDTRNSDEWSNFSSEDLVNPETKSFTDLENMSGSRYNLNVNISHLNSFERHSRSRRRTCRADLRYAFLVLSVPIFHSVLRWIVQSRGLQSRGHDARGISPNYPWHCRCNCILFYSRNRQTFPTPSWSSLHLQQEHW